MARFDEMRILGARQNYVNMPASNSGDCVRRLNAKGKAVNSVESDIVP